MNKSVDNVNFHNININKTWVDVLDFISPKVGDEAIDTWFQPLELVDINKEQATIRVPNKCTWRLVQSTEATPAHLC